jgi:aminopeptidase N
MPDTEITRAETQERARLLHIRSYDVDLDFTQGPDTFGSISLIRFVSTIPARPPTPT